MHGEKKVSSKTTLRGEPIPSRFGKKQAGVGDVDVVQGR